jgi:hypothetical protein
MATLSVPSSLDASGASDAPWWALHRDGPRHLGSGMREARLCARWVYWCSTAAVRFASRTVSIRERAVCGADPTEDVLLSIFRRRGRPVIRNYRYSKSNRDTHARNRDRLRFDAQNKQERAGHGCDPRAARASRHKKAPDVSDAPRMNRTRVSHTTVHPSTPHHNKRMPFYCQPSIIVTATSPHIRCGELGAPRRAPPRAQCDSVWSARREATQSPSS